MTEETFVCSVCGQSHPMHECTTFEDEELCPQCLDAETRVCHVCGERIWRDDNVGDEDTPLCEHCYERHYTSCARCGALLPLDSAYYLSDDADDEDPLCYSCYLLRSADRDALE